MLVRASLNSVYLTLSPDLDEADLKELALAPVVANRRRKAMASYYPLFPNMLLNFNLTGSIRLLSFA